VDRVLSQSYRNPAIDVPSRVSSLHSSPMIQNNPTSHGVNHRSWRNLRVLFWFTRLSATAHRMIRDVVQTSRVIIDNHERKRERERERERDHFPFDQSGVEVSNVVNSLLLPGSSRRRTSIVPFCRIFLLPRFLTTARRFSLTFLTFQDGHFVARFQPETVDFVGGINSLERRRINKMAGLCSLSF